MKTSPNINKARAGSNQLEGSVEVDRIWQLFLPTSATLAWKPVIIKLLRCPLALGLFVLTFVKCIKVVPGFAHATHHQGYRMWLEPVEGVGVGVYLQEAFQDISKDDIINLNTRASLLSFPGCISSWAEKQGLWVASLPSGCGNSSGFVSMVRFFKLSLSQCWALLLERRQQLGEAKGQVHKWLSFFSSSVAKIHHWTLLCSQ